MPTQDFEALRADVEALGFQLFMDCSLDEADQPRGEHSPLFYVNDPWTDRHVIVGTYLDVEGWLAKRESGPKAGNADAHLLQITDDLCNTVRYARRALRVLGGSGLQPYQHDAFDAILDSLLMAQNLIDELHQSLDLVAWLAPHGQPAMQDAIAAEIREKYSNASRRELVRNSSD